MFLSLKVIRDIQVEISNRKWIFRCITQERNLGISSIYIRKLNHGNPEDYSLITACKRKRKKGSIISGGTAAEPQTRFSTTGTTPLSPSQSCHPGPDPPIRTSVRMNTPEQPKWPPGGRRRKSRPALVSRTETPLSWAFIGSARQQLDAEHTG